MRAAVYHGPGDVRVGTVPDAPAPGPGEVTIGVRLCGLCGTDAHEFAHGPAMIPLHTRHPASGHLGPMVPGHEFMGVVTATGRGAAIAPGTRVVAGAGRWCGRCPACAGGRTNLCHSYNTHGLNRDGGLAEYVTVPAAMCAVVPDGCADEDAVLAQPLAIALHALNRSGAGPGDPVVVFGAGGIGTLLIAAAAFRGTPVHVLDVDPERLETAVALGAASARIADAAGLDAVRTLGRTGAPVVIEASGAAAGLRDALRVTGAGGRVVLLGLPSTAPEVDVRGAVVAEVDLISTSAHVCASDLPEAVAALDARPIAGLVVDRVVPLEEVVAGALAPLAAGRLRGKAVVRV
ncbi:zinc-binding dehydrogenase [Streptomyces sp. TS71-3]|uniref:zinc-dependent alcohol dehydrogenase n=1 Tax=Streptomyces sp. TS71-3 TaxID=2733862 RepID=UPI001B2F2820|nr:alcohol dehydrogenase catalytic domain-containing protein [Streptomyces sp. TS71-3]GHJ38478.1 threonine dehydrogenase [Streptomyces sp. TS71-3]